MSEASAKSSIDQSAAGYAQHWERYFADAAKEGPIPDWHCQYPQLKPILEPYLTQLEASRGGKSGSAWRPHARVLDVGCGSSALASGLLADGFARITLLDIVPSQVEAMERQLKDFSEVKCIIGDCRSLPFEDAPFDVVLDKGTLDALNNDEDRIAMLSECLRVSSHGGVFVTVSFAAKHRLEFLKSFLKDSLPGYEMHVHFVGDGDPAKGHEVRLVTVIAKKPLIDAVTYDDVISTLTRTLVSRVEATGSVYRDAESEEEEYLAIL